MYGHPKESITFHPRRSVKPSKKQWVLFKLLISFHCKRRENLSCPFLHQELPAHLTMSSTYIATMSIILQSAAFTQCEELPPTTWSSLQVCHIFQLGLPSRSAISFNLVFPPGLPYLSTWSSLQVCHIFQLGLPSRSAISFILAQNKTCTKQRISF